MVAESGLRRLHLLGWRDLADTEAGGSEVHMAEVAAAFASAGLDVTVRTSYAQGKPAKERRDGYAVVRRSNRYAVFPHVIAEELTRRLGRADGVIEAWNGVPFLTPLWFHGPRVVLLHHVHRDMWDTILGGWPGRLGKVLELRIAPRFYRDTPVVTLGASARQQIIEELHLPPELVTVAHPGIDPRFHEDDTPRADHPLVVAVGRLTKAKRFDDLIRIASSLKPDHPGLEVVIAGDGWERASLEELVADLDAREWIHLPGRVSDTELLSLYRRAWVVASTSMAEGWGMTLTEAAACGTPAVATRISGHTDAVDDGVSGLLGADVREVAGHLDAVLRDPELLDRLADGARKRAAALTWDATARGVFAPLAAQARAGRSHRRR